MAKLGDDWMWIGIGLAAVIATQQLIQPLSGAVKAVGNVQTTLATVGQADIIGFNNTIKRLWNRLTGWI